MNDLHIIKIFVEVDNFCKEFEPWFNSKLIERNQKTRVRKSQLCLSELMTILISFQTSGYRTLKKYYLDIISNKKYLFPNLVSYNRFVELQPRAVMGLMALANSGSKKCTGISYIDSTKLSVCGNKRITRNKVFKDKASIGKSTMGWFYGFKLHLVINELGDILSCHLTKGNVNDRSPVMNMLKKLSGKLFGDKGYISSKLRNELKEIGVELITQVRKKMKEKELSFIAKLLLRKRSIIETINDQLKNICQIEHTRHRSADNFLTNVFSGVVAYMFQDKKPSIRFDNFHLNFDNLLIS